MINTYRCLTKYQESLNFLQLILWSLFDSSVNSNYSLKPIDFNNNNNNNEINDTTEDDYIDNDIYMCNVYFDVEFQNILDNICLYLEFT